MGTLAPSLGGHFGQSAVESRLILRHRLNVDLHVLQYTTQSEHHEVILLPRHQSVWHICSFGLKV